MENMAKTSEKLEEINILLLGESGVGKSTFINSCINYLQYPTFKDAYANQPKVLIPLRFHITDKDFTQVEVQLGSQDENEKLEDAVAATQDVKTYIFFVVIENKKYLIRFIDTPGLGDQRGPEQDQKNCELILGFLSHFKTIHGFCILLKPNSARMDIFLNYVIVQILSRLERSAVENIAFLFTKTRGTNFTPGETFTSLKVLIDRARQNNNIEIPLKRDNMFCFDNEGIKFLAAVKQGVQFEDYVYSATELSWNVSGKELWRLLTYVTRQKPHDLQKTLSINDARKVATQLLQPITEIIQITDDNIRKLEQHTKELAHVQLTREELQKKLYMPHVEIQLENLEFPHTVCTHKNCTKLYMVNGIRKTHYENVCCNQCWSLFVTPEIVGNVALYTCTAFGWDGYCRKCKHFVTTHMHIYYETNIVESQTNPTTLPDMANQDQLIRAKEELIQKLCERTKEFETERQIILRSCVAFDQFLIQNSVTPISAPVKDYLEYQITREKTSGESSETVSSLIRLLEDYGKEQRNLRGPVTPQEIENYKKALLHLKHFGSKISEMYTMRQAGSSKNYKKKETVIETMFKKFQDVASIAKIATAFANQSEDTQ